MDFPNTENGALLLEMHQAGMDLSIPHDIDFFHNFQKKREAEKMWREVAANDSTVKFSLTETEAQDGWILCCTVRLIPAHDVITQTEVAFDKIALKFNGESDGWGVLQP